MSEYQYYEFAAIDRPLDEKQRAELRSLSSRATITASSFVNEYNWGDLKGDPLDWMRRWFDAHVYSANWQSCRLLLRLPRSTLDQAMLDDFVKPPRGLSGGSFGDAFVAHATNAHWILEWNFNDDEGERDRFCEGDGPGWMARLLPLRDELLRGDTRPLYLGWLARVCSGELADGDKEPPVPAGLRTLTPAQLALAEFLELDLDWLAAAAEVSPDLQDTADIGVEVDNWLSEHSVEALRAPLRQILQGQSQQAERELRAAFAAWLRKHKAPQAVVPKRRSVAQIDARREAARSTRLAVEQRARNIREKRLRAEHVQLLTRIAQRADETWAHIDQHLQRGSGSGYDQALAELKTLSEALKQAGREAEFRQGLGRLMKVHGTRPAWAARLTKAGLIKE
jgi:hypothetical protein